jgi:cation:H+ antiporter
MFGSLSLPILLLIFGGAAAFVWVAGIRLSDTADVLSARLGLGQALGGLILLAIVTNLPEIAITASAALSKELGVAVGNILGGSPSKPSCSWCWTPSECGRGNP